MHEQLKKLCPIEIIRNLGAEAVWMFNTAKQVRQSVVEMTFEEELEVELRTQ